MVALRHPNNLGFVPDSRSHSYGALKPNYLLVVALGTVCLGITQAVFWTFTYPMNVASNNWTVMPDSFEAARRQWEYSHAVNAVLTFVAFIALTLAVLSDKSLPPPTPNSRVA
jgi:hypothetical protein